MQHFDRQPPRFVPTLTDVVPEGLPLQRPAVLPSVPQDAAVAPPVREVLPGAAPWQAMAHGVRVPVAEALVQQPQVASPASVVALPNAEALQEALVERLMARVQPLLEERLRYAVTDIVRTQTEALAHSLRDAVEDVVRNAVADAVAEERNHPL